MADDMEELSDESQRDDGVELVANASEDESSPNTGDIAEVAAPPTRRQLRAHISIASSEPDASRPVSERFVQHFVQRHRL